MNIIKQMGVGMIFGLLVVGVFILMDVIDIRNYLFEIVIGILIMTFLLWISASLFRHQILKLVAKEVTDEEEDAVEVIKYRKFSDMSLAMQVSAALATLAFCLSLMMMQVYLIIISIIVLMMSYFLTVWTYDIMHKMYPERNLPEVSDKHYAQKLLEISDDGEKFVMVQGLYKAYNLANILLMVGMIVVTLYAMFTEQSNMFAVFVMALILICINGRYIFSIRQM